MCVLFSFWFDSKTMMAEILAAGGAVLMLLCKTWSEVYISTHTHTHWRRWTSSWRARARVLPIIATIITTTTNSDGKRNAQQQARSSCTQPSNSQIKTGFFSLHISIAHIICIYVEYIYIYTMQANTTLLVVSVTLSMSWLADCRLYFYFLVFRITWWFLPRDIRGIIIGRRIVLAKQRTRNERRQYHSMQQWANVGWAMRSAECPVRKLWLCVCSVSHFNRCVVVVVLFIFFFYSFLLPILFATDIFLHFILVWSFLPVCSNRNDCIWCDGQPINIPSIVAVAQNYLIFCLLTTA